MMVHHGTETYEVAASAAAKVQKQKLEQLIHKGEISAQSVIEQIMAAQPTDRIVPGRVVSFGVEKERMVVADRRKPGNALVHPHALQQVTEKVAMPWAYAQTLQATDWGRKLLAENLNKLYDHEAEEKRFLLRFARKDGIPELRGFLSDKYRRLDARPITEALTQALQKAGALPYEGVATDTRVALRAILPKLYEPVKDEIVAFGLNYETSDFGDGALSVGLFMLRMSCTNLATAEDMLRKVQIELSQKIFQLDTATMASAVHDIVSNVLAPATTEKYCLAIKAAHDEKVDGFSVGSRLKAIGLTKVEQAQVIESFNSANVEEVPAGMNAWRLSNALSWVANKTPDARRRMEMQKLAGSVVAVAA